MSALVISLILATSNFPETISSLSGREAPDCSLCHQNGVARRGTVTTPFGAAMMQAGMVSGDSATVRTAWGQLDANQSDSDKDGVSDVQELKSGRNPNVAQPATGAGDVEQAPLPPTYGCSAVPGMVWLGTAMSVIWVFRRKR